jgi:hypothetical protein
MGTIESPAHACRAKHDSAYAEADHCSAASRLSKLEEF